MLIVFCLVCYEFFLATIKESLTTRHFTSVPILCVSIKVELTFFGEPFSHISFFILFYIFIFFSAAPCNIGAVYMGARIWIDGSRFIDITLRPHGVKPI